MSDLISVNITKSSTICPSDVKSHFNDIVVMYSIGLLHLADFVSQEIFMWAVK